MKLGSILKACRERKGYTQAEMADLLDYSQGSISQIEKDRKSPDIHILLQWAEITNSREVIVAYIYGLDGVSLIKNILQDPVVA